MPDSPTIEELRRSINAAIDELNEASAIEAPGMPREAVSMALQMTLLAYSASIGECRRQTPYSPLRPVITADGDFRWCCNHDPEHCAGNG